MEWLLRVLGRNATIQPAQRRVQVRPRHSCVVHVRHEGWDVLPMMGPKDDLQIGKEILIQFFWLCHIA